jgi:magnesium-transporting ATPase (P-type)
VLLSLALLTAVYWYFVDPSLIINSVSAMLIVACPCALLLSATFTNGNIMRLLSNNGLYLRDPSVIEQLGKTDHVVFDKTGTLTEGANEQITCKGSVLTDNDKDLLFAVKPEFVALDQDFVANVKFERESNMIKDTGASKSGDMRALFSMPQYLYAALHTLDPDFTAAQEDPERSTKLNLKLAKAFPEYRLARKI